MRLRYGSICTAIFVSWINLVQAQDYHIYSLSVGSGLNHTYADTEHSKLLASGLLQFDYAINRNLQFSINAQVGRLAGADGGGNRFGKNFENNYQTLTLGYKLYLGALITNTESETLEALKKFFLGVEGGVIRNSVRNIQPFKNDLDTYAIQPSSYNLILPITVGYELPIAVQDEGTRFHIRLAYQGNFTFGEGLDGYREIGKDVNKNPDIFTVFSLGVGYRFGATRW